MFHWLRFLVHAKCIAVRIQNTVSGMPRYKFQIEQTKIDEKREEWERIAVNRDRPGPKRNFVLSRGWYRHVASSFRLASNVAILSIYRRSNYRANRTSSLYSPDHPDSHISWHRLSFFETLARYSRD